MARRAHISCCSTTRRQKFASSCRHFSDGGFKHMKSLCIYYFNRAITLTQALQISKLLDLQGVAVMVVMHHMHWSINLYVHYSIAVLQSMSRYQGLQRMFR